MKTNFLQFISVEEEPVKRQAESGGGWSRTWSSSSSASPTTSATSSSANCCKVHEEIVVSLLHRQTTSASPRRQRGNTRNCILGDGGGWPVHGQFAGNLWANEEPITDTTHSALGRVKLQTIIHTHWLFYIRNIQ